MCKTACVFLLLFCGWITTTAQIKRFSMQYNFNVPVTPHLGQNVFKTNGGYLLAGYTSNTVTGVDKGVGIIATDDDGNVVWQKQTASAQGYQYSNNTANQAFIQLQNKDLLFTGQYELGIDYSKACMARVSHLTGDTLWTRMYSQPGDSTYLLCSTELSDSSIISFGFRYYLNTVASVNYTKPFMLKVDKHGNYKWHKYINGIWTNSIFFMYQKVIRLNDNDFVVVGYKSPNVCYPQAFCMRIDTNAVKQYEVNFTGYQNPIVFDAILLQDGRMLSVGSYYTYNPCNANPSKLKKLIYIFDPATGTKLLAKDYNKPSNASGLTCVMQASNGIVYAGGATTDESTVNSYNYASDVLKLSLQLDSITTLPITNTVVGFSHNMNQIVASGDGGFYGAIASYPLTGQQKFWLIKADSNGCYSSSCSTIGLEERVLTDGNWDVYPNPSTGVVYMRLPQAGQTGVVEIRDVNGKRLAERIVNGEEHIELPTENLSAGVYMVRFIQAGVAVETRKLVLTR